MSTPTSIVDTRIKNIRPLIPPACLLEELPLPSNQINFILTSRQTITSIIHHQTDKLLVIIGPCSIHDVNSAYEYANKLKKQYDNYSETLLIAMRVYFEKPRTTVGWKGLINDPTLNNSFSINSGLRLARKLLLSINQLNLPIACEMLDTITPQFIGDLISWAAIGARTTESQLHRELVSGLSMPIGFKNGTSGNKKIAVDAIVASSTGHAFLSVTTQGLAAIVETSGNNDCHIVLRGGEGGPNYSVEDIKETEELLKKNNLDLSIMVDCSHGNSNKNHNNQVKVVEEVCKQLAAGSNSIIGVMIESNLFEGKQSITLAEGETLKYGVSVTDACIGWETSEQVLEMLHQGVLARRKFNKENGRNGA